jgi:late competence protein required for DNA uptake (superfamily II DNA/RNA helicase)
MDHNALRWLRSMEPKGRLACWIIDLQEFNFTVVYRAGRLHTNTDALSRLVQSPGEQEEQASATATTTCHNLPASMESEVVKGAIYLKKLIRINRSQHPYLIYIQKPNGKKTPKGLDKQGKQTSGQNYQIDLLPTSSAKLTTLMAFFCQAGIP